MKNDLIVLEKKVCQFVMNNEQINRLKTLFKESDLILFGGAIRDLYFNQIDKVDDLDIVIKLPFNNYKKNIGFFNKTIKKAFPLADRNTFKGYKIKEDCVYIIDIWPIEITLAFRKNIIKCTIDNLINTVFLNLDSIAFNIKENKLIFDNKFIDFLETKLIKMNDILVRSLRNENPIDRYVININICRALLFSEKYDLIISDSLKQYISTWLNYIKPPYHELITAYDNHIKNSKKDSITESLLRKYAIQNI